MHDGTTIAPLRTQTFIKRPRLTKLLDESGARIILLLAPAGYGKTTLAREWTDEQDSVGWYTGAPAMIDVAGLSVGIAEVLGEMGETPRPDMVERVRILAARGHDPRGLAKAVSGGAPGAESILVIDDYHHALESVEAETFVEELVSLTEFRLLITSRDRPGWLPARKFVYGQAAVVEMDALAFTDEEALAVLGGGSGANILAEARGWPAVIGLAAVRGDVAIRASGLQGDDLYEFFAEDLFRSASRELQDAMFLLALAGVDGARALLGQGYLELVSQAAERGFLAGADRQVVHPLLRGFLLAKLRELDDAKRDGLVASAVKHLATKRQWDDCLFVLERFPDERLIVSTLEHGLAEILDSGRIATVSNWLSLAARESLDSPLLHLAEAEVALRERANLKAQALGKHAGGALTGDQAARAFITAARAAHLRDDWNETARLCDQAMTAALTDSARIEALWLAFSSSIEQVNSDPQPILDQIEAFDDGTPSHSLRLLVATALQLCQRGSVRDAIHHLEVARELMPKVADPFARTNLLHHAAYSYVLAARYDDALASADSAITEARETGLQFVIDYSLLRRAAAQIGVRRLAMAHSTLRELDRRSAGASEFVRRNVVLQHARLAITTGDLHRAAMLLGTPSAASTRPAFRGEVLGHRALIYAATGDHERAVQALQDDSGCFTFVEAAALRSVAEAIMAIQQSVGTSARLDVLTQLITAGEADAIVIGYRAYPNLICEMLSAGLQGPVTTLLIGSRDYDLARANGLRVPRESRPRQALSTREQQVYELLVQGRPNREIAKTLFISESTTKVHVRHIFEKLGVHSRAEAAGLRHQPDA